jgi:D-glycero-D-manno-heptose 1,7-bisphosphate phosphatase
VPAAHQSAPRPAVFFDRDGTLNVEVGYVRSPADFHIYPFAADAVRRVNESGWLAVVITNQAGVARGYFTEQTVRELNDLLRQSLAVAGAHLDAIYYCPHHPEHGSPEYRIVCECRKPNPGMMLLAMREHNIDLAASWVISDRYQEIAMAHALGARGALVLTGYGEEDYLQRKTWKRTPDFVASDALSAIDQIFGASARASAPAENRTLWQSVSRRLH